MLSVPVCAVGSLPTRWLQHCPHRLSREAEVYKAVPVLKAAHEAGRGKWLPMGLGEVWGPLPGLLARQGAAALPHTLASEFMPRS